MKLPPAEEGFKSVGQQNARGCPAVVLLVCCRGGVWGTSPPTACRWSPWHCSPTTRTIVPVGVRHDLPPLHDTIYSESNFLILASLAAMAQRVYVPKVLTQPVSVIFGFLKNVRAARVLDAV